jgi:hypothetical protein
VPARPPRRRRHRRVEQLDQLRAAGERRGRPPPGHRLGDAQGEALLAVLAQHPGQRRHRVGVEHLRGGDAGRLVHPHVQVRVLGVGEPAGGRVELQRRHPQVEQDPLDGGQPQLRDDLADAVVHGVHQVRAVGERGEAPPGQGQGVGVAVETDEGEPRVLGQQRRRVAAETQRRVHQRRGTSGERGREEFGDAGQEHRDVPGPSRPVRYVLHRSPPTHPGAVRTVLLAGRTRRGRAPQPATCHRAPSREPRPPLPRRRTWHRGRCARVVGEAAGTRPPGGRTGGAVPPRG